MVGATVEEYAAGSALLSQGSNPDTALVLISGAVEVVHRVLGGEVAIAVVEEPGSFIGEVAILAGGLRNASVRALDDVTVVALPGPTFEALLARLPQLAVRLSAEALRRNEETQLRAFIARAFGTNDPAFLDELATVVDWQRFRGGEVIFHHGDPADAAYVVISGRLLVSSNDSEGRLQRLAELGKGEIVGELGLLDGGYRHATVSAMRDSVLVRIPVTAFDTLIERRPRQMIEAARRIVRRARQPARARNDGVVMSVAVTSDLDPHSQCLALAEVLTQHGATDHLWPGRLDSLLSRAGAALSSPGDPIEATLTNLIHKLELANSFLVLEVSGWEETWAERGVRQSDRVVVIASSVPNQAESERIKNLFALAPEHAEKVLVLSHSPGVASPSGCAGARQATDADLIVNIRQGSKDDQERLGRILAGRAYGLVLGGGGARGFAHIGVYRALLELGVPIDWVGGASIGAVFAAAIARDIPPDELVAMTPKLFRGVLDYTLPIVSLVKGRRITSNIDSVFAGVDFEDLWRGCFTVSTNLTRSKSVIHRSGPLAIAIRASLAIPGVIPPVPMGEDLLVDGGVLDNVPTGVMRQILPGGTVIAVDLAPPLGPRAKSDFGLAVSGWRVLLSRARGRRGPAYPGLAAVLLRSMITGSSALRDAKIADTDLYLDLDLRGVGMLDFDAVEPVVEAGYAAAKTRLGVWLQGPA